MRNARAVRVRLGLTLEQVARETGIPFSNISGFERGVNGLGADRLLRLSEHYGCTINELLADAPEPESDVQVEPEPAAAEA